jgi:hypothetical protein
MITMNEVMRLAKDRSRNYTAQEWQEVLLSCPEWVAQDAAREAKRQAAEAQFRIEEGSIIVDLAKAGFTVGSVWDLVNTGASYPAAIPVLLEHLKRQYHNRIRNGIIRALTVREARMIANQDILYELQREQDLENRWALANALTVVADQHDIPAIMHLLADPAYADVHERLTAALKMLSPN